MKRRHTNKFASLQLRQLALWVALALGASTVALGQTESVSVTSATNSEIVVVTLVPVEGGGFTLDGEPFTGGRVTLEGGFEYVVSQATDGTWMAMYQPTEVSFALGELGGMLTLVAQEDGTFTDAEGVQVVSGQTVDAAGNAYRLTLGEDGTWQGTYVQPLPQTVELGTQGSVAVTRAEDGSWWIGETGLATGDTYELGANATGAANRYRLTLEDGQWSAAYVPASLTIAGTDLLATPDEDGGGYTVEGTAELKASGIGDITVRIGEVDEMYHVWNTDDGLAGARFDLPIKSNVTYTVDVKGDAAAPTLSTDNTKTPGNETRTMVKAVGTDFSLGALLGDGRDAAMPEKTVRADVRAEIAKLRDQVRALVDLYNDDAIDRATFDSQVNTGASETDKWDRADAQVRRLFGSGDEVVLERESNPRRAVDAFDALLEALDSEAAFVDATEASGGGVFEFAELGASAAERTFHATLWTAEAVFSGLGSTRFGAAKRRQRANAQAANYAAAMDDIQVFAWSTTDLVRRASEVQAAGNAYYTGRTHAADSDGNLYSGEMELSVRFARRQVDGLVRNLATADGDRWEHDFGGDVENIFLPTATLTAQGTFSVSGDRGDARVTYERRAGGTREETIAGRAGLTGRLLGRGETAGSEAIGTWRINAAGETPAALLAGAFGVRRGADRPDPSQPLVDDLRKAGTSMARAHLVVDGANGLLSQEQYELGGDGFVALIDQTFRSLAEIRAAIRAAAGAVTLSDAEVDKVISYARFARDDSRAVSAASLWSGGFTASQGFVRLLFDRVVQTKAHGARTLFGADADAGTFVVWPTWSTSGTGPAGEPYARNHPVQDGWHDPRAFDRLARSEMRFEIDKETLFGEGYGIVSEDRDAAVAMHEILGETHVAAARKEIARLRGVLRSVIALDSADASATDRRFANDRRQELFTQIQAQLADEIFGGAAADLNVFGTRAASPSGSSAWTNHSDYPVNGAGLAQDAQLLNDIDDVIAALSSEDALDAALGAGGIFADQDLGYNGVLYESPRIVVTDASPATITLTRGSRDFEFPLGREISKVGEDLVLPASHIFNKARARLLLVTDSTDFTRLGAWRVQESHYAADTLTEVHHGAQGFYVHNQRPEPFVYSPLEQVAFSSADDRSFPAGGRAVYRGRTTAAQFTQFLAGDVELEVVWQPAWDAADADGQRKIGELNLTISDLVPTNPGITALRQGLPDYEAEVTGGLAVPRAGTFDVRSLHFDDVDITVDADGLVGFGDSAHDRTVRVMHDTLAGTLPQSGIPASVGDSRTYGNYLDNWWYPIRPVLADGRAVSRLGVVEGEGGLDAGGPIAWRVNPDPNTGRGSYLELSGNPGHYERLSFEHWYTKGAAKGRLNVIPELNKASIEGKFVGDTGDGPRAVIGTWSIRGRHWMGVGGHRGNVDGDASREGDILGSFGADFAPTP